MDNEIEKMCVYYLIKLRSTFERFSNSIKTNFQSITDKDWQEIEKLSNETIFGTNVQKKKQLKKEIDNIGEFVYGCEEQDVFEILTLNRKDLEIRIKEQLKKFRIEDVFITLKDFDLSTYKKIKGNAIVKSFAANDSFMRFIDIDNYMHCVHDVLITFNRELLEYQNYICKNISDTYKLKNLIEDLLKYFNTEKEVGNIISRLVELRARRNIVEHNQSVINEKYINTSHKYEDKNGALLVTSPGYVTERYKDIISFYVIATKLCLQLKGKQMDEDFLCNEVKKTKNLQSASEYILSLKID